MKDRLLVGLIVLIAINVVTSGVVLVEVTKVDKRTTEICDVLDGTLSGISDEIDAAKNAAESAGIQALFLERTVEDIVDKVGVIGTQLNVESVSGEESRTEPKAALAVEIWVDEQNTVHRTGVDSSVTSLGWVVLYNGEEVLSRNALNETAYKYYRDNPGTYTIYMDSFIDGSYKVVSNVVSYFIE